MGDRTVTATLRAQVSQFVGGIRNAHQQYQKFSNDLVDNTAKRQALGDLSNMAIGVGTALTGAFLYATKVTMDFDKQMSAVGAASGATASELDQLRTAALRAGEATSFSAREAAKAEEELAKAGLTVSEILSGGLTGALNLAAAGGIEVADAAEIAATALKQFKLAGSDIPHVADLLASGANSAQGGVKELGEALNQSGLVAAQFGLSIEETVGSLTAFASAGLLGSDAGTSFKTMLLRLAAPSAEATRMMDKLGIAAYDAQGQFVGMEAFAGQLDGALGDLSQQQRDQAMATIFGSDAIRAANVLFAEGAEGVSGWEQAVDKAGAAAETARKKTDNLAGDLERLQGAMETALIEGGSGATGVLRELTQTTEHLVEGFAGLPAPITGTITGLVAVGGVAALAVGGFSRMVVSAAETREALNELEVSGTRSQKGMARIAKGAGKAALALGALQVGGAVLASTFGGEPIPIDQLARDLDKFGESGKTAGQVARLLGDDMNQMTADMIDGGFDANLGLMIESILGIGHLWDSTATKSREAIQTIDQGLATMVQSGNIEGAEKAYERLEKAAVKQGVAVKDVKESFSLYHAALEASLSKNDVLGSSLEGLTEKGYTLTDALNTLYGATLKFASAEIAAEQAADDFKAALDESNGSMDVNTEAGRRAKSAMLGLVGAAIAAAEAKYEETGSTQAAVDTYNDYIDALKETLRQAGYTESEIDDLISTYAKIPKSITTKIETRHVVTFEYKDLEDFQKHHGVADGAVFNANGGVRAFADGGMHRVAQIARPGEWRVWAEDETGGEAYIPLAASKRTRSMAIWRETGRRLGAIDPSITAQQIVKALESSGRGDTHLHVNAWSDTFSFPQVMREAEMHGVV